MKRKKHVAKRGREEGNYSASAAGLAFKHGFYLETAWILSVIFEKKSKSLLKKLEPRHLLPGYSFEQSIKRIKYHHLSGRVPQLGLHLELNLIEEMRSWKNSRNTMLKDMVSVHVSKNRMERLASEGIALYKRWNKSLKLIKTEMKKSTIHKIQKGNTQFDEEQP